ncbi:MAG: ribosome maturation factor RimM [Alphaproteobacteria bacterium]
MKRVCLGKITTAHGIKGLVKILPFGEDPLLIEDLGPMFTSETGNETLSITMKNSAGNKYWLAAVEGVTERNGAEALRGTELWIGRDTLPTIEENNTYYHTDLIGLRVMEGNTEIGHVTNIQNYGAGDLVEIIESTGKTFLVPLTKKLFPEINIKEKYLLIKDHAEYKSL